MATLNLEVLRLLGLLTWLPFIDENPSQLHDPQKGLCSIYHPGVEQDMV